MSDSVKVVRDFCKAWERKDVDELVGFMTDDAIYHNIPLQPAAGHEAIKGVMAMFVPMSNEIEFKINAIAADGDTVFTERVDTFVMDGGNDLDPRRRSLRSEGRKDRSLARLLRHAAVHEPDAGRRLGKEG